MTSAITTAAIAGASRILARAVRLSADAEVEPPPGIRLVTALARFATPWPTKSRDASALAPDVLAYADEMPAPWIIPTKARETTGSSRSGEQ
jgi:hypothetical protein